MVRVLDSDPPPHAANSNVSVNTQIPAIILPLSDETPNLVTIFAAHLIQLHIFQGPVHYQGSVACAKPVHLSD